jgi:hypothetical protein
VILGTLVALSPFFADFVGLAGSNLPEGSTFGHFPAQLLILQHSLSQTSTFCQC